MISFVGNLHKKFVNSRIFLDLYLKVVFFAHFALDERNKWTFFTYNVYPTHDRCRVNSYILN